MVVINRSQRTNLPPGGSDLPAPSGTRLNIAGQSGRDIAGLGETIASIGLKAQRANDNAELKTETISAETELNAELARIKQEVQDPEEYLIQSTKVINDISGNVGFRNRTKFDNILAQLKGTAKLQVAKEQFGKVVDKSKAAHTLLKDTVAVDVSSGKLTQETGTAIVGQSTNELVGNGIFDQEDKVAEDRAFPGRLAEIAFEAKFPTDPTGAIKELNENKNISIEVKNNLIDKEVRKFNLFEKKRKEANRLDRMARVKDFKFKARRGEATEDEVLQDAVANPDNPMSVDETFSIINEINKVEKEGGVGNPDKFNEMMRNIRRNPDLFSINDIYDFEDANDLNADESERLEAKWETLTTGRSDPNDITTFREFNNSIKFTTLFAPSRFDVGAQLGVKKLRFDQAYGFAEARAIELFKTNKNVDTVMAQVEFDTLKHMQEYDKLVQEFIDEGTLEEGETSIFEVKRLVEPQLKEQEKTKKFSEELKGKISPTVTAPPEGLIRTDAQLDEIEAIFDKAEAEGRELTEDEIQKINDIQEILVGDNT